jgi:outer membrane protein insertion porin family
MNRSSTPSAPLRNTLAIAVAAVFAASAWAQTSFTVRDIRVEGIQRTEPGTVFGSLPFRVGDVYNEERGTAAIRALFATGLFKDVRLEIDRDVLIVVVEERPIIADVTFSGIREFDQEQLRKALREVGLAEGRPYDRGLADRAEQELKRQYLGRSLFGAEVVTTVTPLERNRVNLTFSVVEGETAKIKEIRIVGARAFSETTLLSQMDLTTGGWLSWYTKSDRYSRSKLNGDLESIRSFYQSRGYMDFRIDSTQVSISPDRADITIVINITEGPVFTVAGARVVGEFFGRDDEFKSLVSLRAGEPVNAERVADVVKAISERFGAFGYAFARVEPRTEIDRTTNQVLFTFVADPGRRAYVRRINIEGNSRTRDEVIRREFRQFESAWYDADKIKLSRDRVDRLGFFKEVTIDQTEVVGTNDQVDINMKVEEKPTGNLNLGFGFSSVERFTVTAGIRQENVFGSGQYVGLDLNTSRLFRTLVFSSVNPYFTKDGVSRVFDVFYRTQRPFTLAQGDYRLVTLGTGLRFGIPFSEQDTVFFGFNIEGTRIDRGNNMPTAFTTFINQFGRTSVSVPLTVGWARDERDSALAPSRGTLQRANGELGVLGDTRYWRATYNVQTYAPLTRAFTLAFNGDLGLGGGYGNRPYPVFKNFFAGGLGSVRGYQAGTLGPRDAAGFFIGGSRRVNLSFEAQTALPGTGNDRTIRAFGFVDMGNVFAQDQRIRFQDMRMSAGVGLNWLSPLGPLRFSYGIPLNAKPQDRIQRFQFQVGTAF